MDNIIAIVLGFVASFLQGSKTANFTTRTKYIIAFASCIVSGLVATFITSFTGGTFEWTEVLANIGLAFTTSQGYYNLYFRFKK